MRIFHINNSTENGDFHMRLGIQKLGYSRSPWRLVDLDREDFGKPVEIAVPVVFDHPTCGRTVIVEPVMGNSKTEVIERTLDLLGRLIEQRTAAQRS